MRLITYNIRTASRDLNPFGLHYWYKRTKRQLSLLGGVKPNVLCLQEATLAQLAMYALKGYRYKGKFCETITLVKDAEIMAYKTIELHREGKYTRYSYYTQIRAKNGIYNVFNCHTDWGDNLKVQLMEIADLAEDMENVIICGDFNSESVELMGFRHLVHGHTFNSLEEVSSTLDHVFVDNVAYKNGCYSQVRGEFGDASDHLPVLVEA